MHLFSIGEHIGTVTGQDLFDLDHHTPEILRSV